MKYFNYLAYILRHKWFVMLECFKRGLIWRGILHDWSKFLPHEFIPYMEHFWGKPNPYTKMQGYSKANDKFEDPEFDIAWLRHQKRNDHHWQWWLLQEDSGPLKIIEMSTVARTEMLCDLIGAGKARGFNSPADDPYFEVRNWYAKNKNKMILGPLTREWLESIILTEV